MGTWKSGWQDFAGRRRAIFSDWRHFLTLSGSPFGDVLKVLMPNVGKEWDQAVDVAPFQKPGLPVAGGMMGRWPSGCALGCTHGTVRWWSRGWKSSTVGWPS